MLNWKTNHVYKCVPMRFRLEGGFWYVYDSDKPKPNHIWLHEFLEDEVAPKDLSFQTICIGIVLIALGILFQN